MALLRIFDAFEDVYYSEFQRSGRLDIAGKACFARIFTTTFLWSGLYWVTQDLLLATLVTFAVTCVVLVVAYGIPARGLFSLLPSFNLRGIGGILWECLPLFIAAFLNQYLANAPRFAIHASLRGRGAGCLRDHLHARGRHQHAVPVRLPSTPHPHGAALGGGQTRGVFRDRSPRLLTTAGAFVLVALVTYVIGAPLLTLVYSTDVSDYVPELMVLVLGGALNAAGVILYYALATMRRLRAVLVAFLIAGGTAYLAAAPLVRSFAMMGASPGLCFNHGPARDPLRRVHAHPRAQRAHRNGVRQWLTALIPPSKLPSSWSSSCPTWAASNATRTA